MLTVRSHPWRAYRDVHAVQPKGIQSRINKFISFADTHFHSQHDIFFADFDESFKISDVSQILFCKVEPF
jgi:hypothetical protein